MKPQVLVTVWWQEIPSPERVVLLCNLEALLRGLLSTCTLLGPRGNRGKHSFVSVKAPAAPSQSGVFVMLSERQTAVAKSPSAPSLSLHRDQNQYCHTEKLDDTRHIKTVTHNTDCLTTHLRESSTTGFIRQGAHTTRY